jgi:hypothetical protein
LQEDNTQLQQFPTFISPTTKRPFHQSPIPTLYTTIVPSDKETTVGGAIGPPPEALESSLVWQKADYV